MRTLIKGDHIEKLGLPEATRNVLEECRMVLPGIQALFGFQLIAVFNRPFFDLLSTPEQYAHLVAVCMTVTAIALVMAPAAYHRQVHPEAVSKRHLKLSSWFLTLGMIPLIIALSIDVYLVARLISHSPLAAGLITAALTGILLILWLVLPRIERHHLKGEIHDHH